MKSKAWASRAAAFGLALVANGAVICLLMFSPVRRGAAPAPDTRATLQVELVRPSAVAGTQRPTPPGAPAGGRASMTRNAPGAEEPAAKPLSPPARQGPSAASAPIAAARPPAGSADDDRAAAAALASLLQHLRDCSGSASTQRERDAGCYDRRAGGPAVEALTAAQKDAFDAAARRREDQMETAGAMQRNTLPPNPAGSVAHYGCGLRGGKWRCGAY